MWASAFVRGQLGSVRAHKLPCQEEPRLFSAILSNGELAAAANTFFFFETQTPYCFYPADSFTVPLRVADGDSSPDVAAFMSV